MNASGIRRNLKNIVHNYSEAQVKVREATSNDPWGPSSTIMSEIADLTYNVVAFSEIMQMIWKRLNDHGRNWRHVYKALVLLEYLIKTGTEKVAQQCKENIFAIQTLKDFQYIEDNKDQGINVREKAKQLVSLLKDDERLKNERARALKAKERFAQATSGIGSETGFGGSGGSYRSDSFGASVNGPDSPQELENARPQTAGEEELQLQLALAMSKEEADQEEQKRRSDDVRLQMAITQSQEDFKIVQDDKKPSALLDLLDVGGATSAEVTAINNSRSDASSTDPWGMPLQSRPLASDPWGSPPNNRAASTSPVHSDPWAPKTVSRSHTPNPNYVSHHDPWSSTAITTTAATVAPVNSASIPPSATDPWGVPAPTTTVASSVNAFGSTPSLSTNGDVDGFDLLSSRAVPSKSTNNLDSLGGMGANPFDMNSMQQNLPKMLQVMPVKKTPESFLGTTNPFANTGQNPFHLQQQQQQQQQRVSINQLRSQQQFTSGTNTAALGYSLNLNTSLPPPIIPAGQAATLGGSPSVNNPFL